MSNPIYNLIDANGNYVPLQRHPDPPTISFMANEQVLQYFGASPTADGLVPQNPNDTAVAWKDGGPLVGWNPATQAWSS